MQELQGMIRNVIGRDLNIEYNRNVELSWQSDTPYNLYFRYFNDSYGASVCLNELEYPHEILDIVQTYYAGERNIKYKQEDIKHNGETVKIVTVRLGERL